MMSAITSGVANRTRTRRLLAARNRTGHVTVISVERPLIRNPVSVTPPASLARHHVVARDQGALIDSRELLVEEDPAQRRFRRSGSRATGRLRSSRVARQPFAGNGVADKIPSFLVVRPQKKCVVVARARAAATGSSRDALAGDRRRPPATARRRWIVGVLPAVRPPRSPRYRA